MELKSINTWLQWPLLILCVAYSCLQLSFEGKQIVKNRSEYFLSQGFIWNFLDLISSILVIAVSCVVLGGLDIGSAVLIVGGMACFAIWLKDLLLSQDLQNYFLHSSG